VKRDRTSPNKTKTERQLPATEKENARKYNREKLREYQEEREKERTNPSTSSMKGQEQEITQYVFTGREYRLIHFAMTPKVEQMLNITAAQDSLVEKVQLPQVTRNSSWKYDVHIKPTDEMCEEIMQAAKETGSKQTNLNLKQATSSSTSSPRQESPLKKNKSIEQIAQNLMEERNTSNTEG